MSAAPARAARRGETRAGEPRAARSAVRKLQGRRPAGGAHAKRVAHAGGARTWRAPAPRSFRRVKRPNSQTGPGGASASFWIEEDLTIDHTPSHSARGTRTPRSAPPRRRASGKHARRCRRASVAPSRRARALHNVNQPPVFCPRGALAPRLRRQRLSQLRRGPSGWAARLLCSRARFLLASHWTTSDAPATPPLCARAAPRVRREVLERRCVVLRPRPHQQRSEAP